MNNIEAKDIIEFFNMAPLPDEGGFFVETYRCTELIKKYPDFTNDICLLT